MFRAVGHGLLLAAGAHALETEMPIYCRLLSVALQGATFEPVLKDMNVSSTVHTHLLGDVDLSVSHLEIDAVRVIGCEASVDHHGHFNVAVTQLGMDLKELQWQYAERRFPHLKDNGRATANTSLSFNVTFDMTQEQHEVLGIHIGALKVHLGAQRHTWLTGALEKTVNLMRPLVSQVVHVSAQHALSGAMSRVYKEGACAFASGALKDLGMEQFRFTSYEPFKIHVPLIGDVNVSVNSTSITPPTSMQCHKLSFNGTALAAQIEDVAFNASFVWAYQKPGSAFWHNKGNGSVAVVAGASLAVDTLQPSATRIHADLPVLKVRLAPESDAWMYNAVEASMTPLIREAAQLFGGRLLAHFVAKCLADPNCPRMRPEVVQLMAGPSSEEVAVLI